MMSWLSMGGGGEVISKKKRRLKKKKIFCYEKKSKNQTLFYIEHLIK